MRRIASYTDLANCVAWFDSIGGLTVSGGVLTSWTDQSGAGLTSPATLALAISGGLATAVGPTYSASDAAFGGKPSITWGTGETALDAPQMAVDLSPPLTFLFCGKFTGAQSPNGRNLFAGTPGVAAARRCSAGDPSTGFGLATELFSVSGLSTSARNIIKVNNTNPFVASFSFTAGRDWRSSVGRQIGWRYCDTVGTARTHCGWRFGRSSTNAITDSGWVGQFNAIVAYNRFMSDQEILLASELMMRRQGVALPTRSAKTRTALPAPGAVGGRTRIL